MNFAKPRFVVRRLHYSRHGVTTWQHHLDTPDGILAFGVFVASVMMERLHQEATNKPRNRHWQLICLMPGSREPEILFRGNPQQWPFPDGAEASELRKQGLASVAWARVSPRLADSYRFWRDAAPDARPCLQSDFDFLPGRPGQRETSWRRRATPGERR